MLDKQTKKKISEVISKKNPVVVMSHMNPDGDAIGSSLALGLYLKKQNVPVSIILPNEAPDFLKWLPGYDMVSINTLDRLGCKKLIEDAATIFFVDFNEPGRTGDLKDTVIQSNAFKILVDHHQDPVSFTDITISEPWRGSAGEMIYLLMKEVSGNTYFDKDIATCLYVAIITDTGNFRYGSSYAEVFTIAGELMEYGIEKNEIFSNIYDSYSVDRMKLLGYCMSEKMIVLNELNTAYISITMDELDRFNHKVGDTEGFVNIPFTIKDIKVTALFIEKKNHVKISLRSKGAFSVDTLAREYFNGGGHINAAGGDSELSLSDTIKKFETEIAKYKDEIS
jgi:phosphoesterase RecJ-like protein